MIWGDFAALCRQCKTVLLLVVDALIFGVPTSPARAMGAAIAICAMCVYTCINLSSPPRVAKEEATAIAEASSLPQKKKVE